MNKNAHITIILAGILLTLGCLSAQETIPISDSAPAPLTATATPGENVPAPQFPGLTIAYILNGNIWLWDEGSPARQLTNGGDATRVRISDDGKIIHYERGQSLWTVLPDGATPSLLLNLPIYNEVNVDYHRLFFGQLEFQPGTHWIYFNTVNRDENSNDDLIRVSIDSPTPEILLAGDGGAFTFSEDGSLLALASINNIKVMRADGSGLVTALHYPTISLESGSIPQVVWMENGTGFYTVLADNTGIKSKYMFISADGSINAQLAELESDMNPPILSPDGLKVAYVKQTATTHELHILEASTADSIIASYEGAPMLFLWNWSPDSQRVAFSNAHPILLLTAGIGIPAAPLTESVVPFSMRWISSDHFIFFREGNLLVGQLNNPETILIASGFSNEVDASYYDFAIKPAP